MKALMKYIPIKTIHAFKPEPLILVKKNKKNIDDLEEKKTTSSTK